MADIVLSKEELSRRVQEMGREIEQDYAGRDLVLIGVLNGAFIFLADLARAIGLDLEIDFIRVASYGGGTSSSGEVRLVKDVELPLAGRHVLLVEDIVDTGLTLAWLARHCERFGAASVAVCALIDKSERREHQVRVDYVGFHVPGGFLVGYGLDHAEKYRNLPEIRNLDEGDG